MNILLIEPEYKNKYPPMGLMKISTYHKNRGDEVTFFKGKMKKDIFEKGNYDRVYITTLFTFYYNQTVKTIEYYKKLHPVRDIYVGGIMASLLTDKLKNECNIQNIMTGLLKNSDILGLGDSVNIDELPLDYSILDEVDYDYPAGDSYISYTTRGCPNHCKFCAVPRLEPHYEVTNNILQQLKTVNQNYGAKRNLMLLDNNIFNLSEEQLQKLVKDLQEVGFIQNPSYFKQNPFEQYLTKRANPKLSKRILKQAVDYLIGLESKFKIEKEKKNYQQLMEQLKNSDNQDHFLYHNLQTIRSVIKKRVNNKLLKRYVDFNQGLEAARITPGKMAILAQLPLRPVRIAFDHYNKNAVANYCNAIRIAYECGIHSFSNYMLYNFEDRPEDLWYRLKINVELASKLHISIFSFPMKYMPIDKTDRKHIGIYWNRKYLQAISAILLVKKGIVASGEDFFHRAFGRDIDEFFMILAMPRDFIIYRTYYEKIGLTQRWKMSYENLYAEEKELLVQILSSNQDECENSKIKEILRFYSTEYAYKSLTAVNAV